ncbi:hypothetical protein GQ42DRAFT_16442 [Ramicandelaber brevisporus]|nr:hypothetical protein GQ42DRAFT_16442 [Ramicandelaber brevisporus]
MLNQHTPPKLMSSTAVETCSGSGMGMFFTRRFPIPPRFFSHLSLACITSRHCAIKREFRKDDTAFQQPYLLITHIHYCHRLFIFLFHLSNVFLKVTCSSGIEACRLPSCSIKSLIFFCCSKFIFGGCWFRTCPARLLCLNIKSSRTLNTILL